MVKEFPERSTRAGPPRLFPINRIKGLVHEQPDGKTEVEPPRSALLERRCPAEKRRRQLLASLTPISRALLSVEKPLPAAELLNQVEGFQNVEAEGVAASGRKSGSHGPPLET